MQIYRLRSKVGSNCRIYMNRKDIKMEQKGRCLGDDGDAHGGLICIEIACRLTGDCSINTSEYFTEVCLNIDAVAAFVVWKHVIIILDARERKRIRGILPLIRVIRSSGVREVSRDKKSR